MLHLHFYLRKCFSKLNESERKVIPFPSSLNGLDTFLSQFLVQSLFSLDFLNHISTPFGEYWRENYLAVERKYKGYLCCLRSEYQGLEHKPNAYRGFS